MTNPPFLSPVFSRSGGVLKYKPHPDAVDYTVWDLSTEFAVITANTAASAAAQTTANTAVTNAAAAQSTANTAVTNAAAAQTTANAAAAAVTATETYPTGHSISPAALQTRTGGFGAPQYLNTAWLSTYYLMTGLNAEAEITLPFAAGNWTITLLCVKGNTGADLTLYVDNTIVSTQAGYTAANTNSTMTWTVTLTKAMHTIRWKINSHTAPSSGYNLAACQFDMKVS